MYIEYRNRIRVKLEVTVENEKIESDETKIINKLQNSIYDENFRKVIFSFKLLEKIDPSLVTANINKIMNHESGVVRNYAQQRMNEIKGLSVSEKYIVNYDSQSDAHKGRYVLSGEDLDDLLKFGDISQRRILKLSRSLNPEDRIYSAELIINSTDSENISLLVELLSDSNFNVRITAIKAAQQRYNNEVIHALIKNLSQSTYSNLAADILTVIGYHALTILDNAFYKSGQTTLVMMKIVQVMGKIGGKKAINLLWNKVDYPDKIVASQVFIALGHSGFKANITQVTLIKYAIEGDVSDISWNLAAVSEVSPNLEGPEIIKALKEENEHDVDHIYMLLCMLYDNQSMQLVKDNIESGTNEGVSFGLELLDVFLSDDLKQRIIPVVDDISEHDKSKKLENLYPRANLTDSEVLQHLIRREFNQTNHWTKACVLHQIGLLRLEEFMYDLIANLFNPDPLIHEISAWAIYNINPILYEEHSSRIDVEVKKKLDVMIVHQRLGLMKFYKIRFMKSTKVFNSVPGLVLSELADMAQDVHMRSGNTILVTENSNYNFYVVYEGEIEIIEAMKEVTQIEQGGFIGEIFSAHGPSGHSLIKAKTNTLLLKFFKDTFYDYLADHINLAERVVDET